MRQTEHPMLNLLNEMLSIPAPSGREEAMARFLRERITSLGWEVEGDAAGNLLVRMAGRDASRGSVIMAAHMDEIGLVVVAVEADGCLRVTRSGGLHPHKIGERALDIVGDNAIIPGVLTVGLSGHSGSYQRPLAWEDCRIWTGLSPAALAEAGVRAGSTAVPARAGRGPLLLGPADDPLVAAWTFDDRAGCATLLRLLEVMRNEEIQPPFPLIVGFTVHEEGGCHGAKIMAHRERPEVFMAVDGCPITPEAPLLLDGRPGVWSKDKRAHYDQRLVHDICRLAQAAGTAAQTAVYTGAASDASAVYDSGGAPRVAFVGHVRANSHGFEVARLSVFDNVLKVLRAFVSDWTG